MWDADPGSLLLVLQILASDAAGVDKLLATLGSGDAFKTKLNAELVKGGLKESTGVTAPAKGEALLMAATATKSAATAASLLISACVALLALVFVEVF